MKKTAALFLSVLSLSAVAQNLSRTISVKIEQLQQAQANGEISRLSESEKQIMNRGLNEALSVIRDNGRPTPRPTDNRPDTNNDPGQWRRNSSYARNQVQVFSDDRCSRLITEVLPRDNCGRLNSIFGNQNAWSVAVNGKCTDILDTSFANICGSAVRLSSAQAPRSADLTVYTDDRCTANLTVIDPGVDCEALGGVLGNTKVWSVKIGNSCVDIPDTTFSTNTCNNYQDAVLASYENDGSRRRGDDVELFSDDRCTNSVMTVKRGTNCQALNGVFNGQKVWSVRFRGQCVDIQDTTFLPACEGYGR